MLHILRAFLFRKKACIYISGCKSISACFLLAIISIPLYALLFKPALQAQGYSTNLPAWVMSLEEIGASRQQWSKEGDIPRIKLLVRNSIRAHFGIKLTNPDKKENKELIIWWTDTDKIELKPDQKTQDILIDMAYASGHQPVSEQFLSYSEYSLPTIDTPAHTKHIESVLNNFRSSNSGIFDLIIGNEDIYQILIGVDLQNNNILVIFPDAGVLHLTAAQGDINVLEQLQQTDFFLLLGTLMGESDCYEIYYAQAPKKPKRKKNKPKPFSGKDIDRYHQSYQKNQKVFAQGKWCALSEGERPSYWLHNSDHNVPVHLIENTEGLTQLHRLETQTRTASDYLYNALCYALYSMRVGLISPELPPENRNWKLAQIDTMLSEQLRFALCTNTEKKRQIWREKHDQGDDFLELMSFWKNISDKIRLSRQWSFNRSLIVTLITPNESIYLQIRDLPVFSVILVLPGELLFYHNTSMEEYIVGKEKKFTPGDPLLAEIWNKLYERYEGEVGKFRVIATLSDGSGSGFGLPAKRQYPGVWQKMQNVSALTGCPFPPVFPSLKTRKRHLKAAQKIAPQLEILMALERKEIGQAEAAFVKESLVLLSPLQHYTKDLKLTTFDTLFASVNKPHYTRLALEKVEQFAKNLPQLKPETFISADMATLLTIPAVSSHTTHVWSHAFKLVKKDEEQQAKTLLTDTNEATRSGSAEDQSSTSQPPVNAPPPEKIVASAGAGDGIDTHQVFPLLANLPPPPPPPMMGAVAPPPPPPPPPGLGATSSRQTIIKLRGEWLADTTNKQKRNKYKSALSSGWKANKSVDNAERYCEYLQYVLTDMDPGCPEMLKSFCVLAEIHNSHPNVEAGDIHETILKKYKKCGKMRVAALPFLVNILHSKFSTEEMLALLEQQAESDCYSGRLTSIVEQELIVIWGKVSDSDNEDSKVEPCQSLPQVARWLEKVKKHNPLRHSAMSLYYRYYQEEYERILSSQEQNCVPVAESKQHTTLKTVWNFGPLSDILMGILPLNMLQRSTSGGFNILGKELFKSATADFSEGDLAKQQKKTDAKKRIRVMIDQCLKDWNDGLRHESSPDDDIHARIMRLSKPARTAFAEEHGSFYHQLEKEWIEQLSAAFIEAAKYYDQQKKYTDSAELLSKAAHLTTAYRETLLFDPSRWGSLLFEVISPLPGFSEHVKKEPVFCKLVDGYICSLSALKSVPKCMKVCQHLKDRHWNSVLECIESGGQKTKLHGFKPKTANTPGSLDTGETSTPKTSPFNVVLRSTSSKPDPDDNPDFIPKDYLLEKLERGCTSFGIKFDQSEKNNLLGWLKLQHTPTQRDIECKVNATVGEKAVQQKREKQFQAIMKTYSDIMPAIAAEDYIHSSIQSGTSIEAFKLGIIDLLYNQCQQLHRDNETLRKTKSTAGSASDSVPFMQKETSISESSDDEDP